MELLPTTYPANQSVTGPCLVVDVVILLKTDQIAEYQPIVFSAYWNEENSVFFPFQFGVGVNKAETRYLF